MKSHKLGGNIYATNKELLSKELLQIILKPEQNLKIHAKDYRNFQDEGRVQISI